MKKNIWKTVAWIAAGVLIVYIVLTFIGILPAPSFLKKHESGTHKAVRILNDYNMHLFYYGEDFAVPEGLTIEKIEHLDSSSIAQFSDSVHSYLIINDLSGNMKLTDEEIELVRVLIHEKHVPFMYYGSQYLNTWDAPDYTESSVGDRAVGYQFQYGNILRVSGFWGAAEDEIYKENKEFLGELIASDIELLYVRECLD